MNASAWRGRLSLPHLTMLDATPPQVIDAAAHAGFQSVSLRLVPTMKNEAPHPMSGRSPMKREVLAALKATGVTVYDIEAIWLRPDSDPRRYEREFETAAELGARCVQVISDDPDHARVAGTLARFCEWGRPLGLGMTLEFMRISQLQSLQAACRVLEAAGQSNAYLTLDALHCYRCDTQPEELARLEPRVIGLVQLCDAMRRSPEDHEAMVHEARFDRRIPGEGELPLHAWLRALPADKVLAIEAPVHPSRAGLSSPRQRAGQLMSGLRAFLDTDPEFP